MNFKYSMFMFALILAAPAPAALANGCMQQAFSDALPAEASWRQAFSYDAKVPTSAAREAELKRLYKPMEDLIMGRDKGHPSPDTPPVEFVAAEGVRMRYLNHTTGDSGIPTRIEVSNVGASGLLKGTILLPVSGHTGVANAQKWAKTDTYTLKYDVSKDQAGKTYDNRIGEGGTELILVKDSKSLDLITSHDSEVKLVKDRIVRILYFRSGSGGPAGYFDGRVVELVWNGT